MTRLAELTMASGHLELSTPQAGIWQLQLQRPATKNALSVAMYQDLASALAAFSQDPAARVLVLVGSAGNFCS